MKTLVRSSGDKLDSLLLEASDKLKYESMQRTDRTTKRPAPLPESTPPLVRTRVAHVQIFT